MSNFLLNYSNPINWIHPRNIGLLARFQVVPWWIGGSRWENIGGLHGRRPGNPNGMGTSATATSGFGLTTRQGGFGEVRFDASNDSVLTNVSDALGDFTAMAWFKSSSDTASRRIMDKQFDTGFWIGHETTGAANQWGGGVLEALTPFGRYVTLTNGSWHRIVSVRQGTTHTIYGDGGSVSTSGTVSSSALDTTAMRIGSNYLGTATFFSGQIDDVRIYNRALSALEVSQDYFDSQLVRDPTLNWMERRIYSFSPTVSATSGLLMRRKRMIV